MHVNDYNHCTIDCDCGWNIHIGGMEQGDLDALKQFLSKRDVKDKTDYSDKINTEPLFG